MSISMSMMHKHMMHDHDPRITPCAKTSVTTINHLSDDLLAEIFSRLPFRSAVTCRCVSKRFRSLISDEAFHRLFISNQHKLADALLIFLSSHELMLAFPPSPFFDEFIPSPGDNNDNTITSPEVFVDGKVCGCCENVFLCSDNRYTSGDGYFLIDPLTKETIQVPSMGPKKECLYAVGFVCDPIYTLDNEQRHTWKTLEPERCFRVVVIKSFVTTQFEFAIDVWHSESDIWKEGVVRCTRGFSFAPHWSLGCAFEGILYFMGRTSIFVYDPYCYRGDTLDYPDGSDPMNIMSFGFLGSSCGKLRVADIGHNDLRIWEMVDVEVEVEAEAEAEGSDDGGGGDNWELVYHVNFSPYLPEAFCGNYYKRVGGFHPHNGHIVYLYSYTDGVFVANLEEKKFTAIPGYEMSDLIPYHVQLLSTHPELDY